MLLAQFTWAESDLEKFANSSQWQRLYQYKNKKSKIQSEIFFFAKEGMTNPLRELESSISAFHDTKILYGTLQIPAACAFPARKKIIEKNLKIKFPEIKCKDLDSWIEQINADKLAIDFAGAYSGNPASIFGHTFFRFYKDGLTREGHELLSHAVGFLAVSPPEDSRAMYMIRGLTGQYPGYYQIEPFYMKVGIYNNSESRDIWEQKLNLTPEEVNFSLLLLWEYSFNAKIPYYFIDENCSYRLLSLLEVVRPEANLLDKFSPVVLPADTVRILLAEGLAEREPKFRSSILRRLNKKLEKLNSEDKKQFEKSKKSIEYLQAVDNAKILDALIDHWTYTNYRAQTDLDESDSKLMEETFLKRSRLPELSLKMDDEELKKNENLIPPYLGHKTSSITILGGGQELTGENRSHGRLSYRMGAHSLTDSQQGYEDIAAIDYLGFDIETQEVWRALLVDAKSIEPLNNPEKKWSWLANIFLENEEKHKYLSDTRLVLRGGGGGALGFSLGKLYFIPAVFSEFWVDSEVDAVLGIGFESGVIFHFNDTSIWINNESNWNRLGYESVSKMNFSYHIKLNHTIFAEYALEDFNRPNNNLNSKIGLVGYKIYL
ncbi:MAG: DUF4105 domain-containing protein [Bdellovibrionota bacterium]